MAISELLQPFIIINKEFVLFFHKYVWKSLIWAPKFYAPKIALECPNCSRIVPVITISRGQIAFIRVQFQKQPFSGVPWIWSCVIKISPYCKGTYKYLQELIPEKMYLITFQPKDILKREGTLLPATTLNSPTLRDLENF